MGGSTTGRKGQLCWTVLPQGFKNSPTLFSEVLAKELEQWQTNNDNVTLLQYVDDILIGADTEQTCTEATVSLLNFLGIARFCWIWIPNVGLTTKPLYAATKGPVGSC